MPYNKVEYYAGATIDTYKMINTSKSKKHKRNKKVNQTPEDVEKQNELLSRDKMTRKINANFCADDLHIILTFMVKKRPSTNEIEKIMKNLFRKMRKKYRAAAIELKYLGTYGFLTKDGCDELETEEIHSDKHNEVAPHIHLIVNYIDIREWTNAWKEYGRIFVFPLDERGEYSLLANYFFNHTKNNFRDAKSPTKQRYFCSRNLINPPPKRKIINAESWHDNPKPKKGYYIDRDSIRRGVSTVTGYPYLFYRQIKVNPRI